MNDIGTREYGKSAIGSAWYSCAICDRHVPEEETVIPAPPHPHAGQRVCLTSGGPNGCFDENDYAMNVALNPPRPSTMENL